MPDAATTMRAVDQEPMSGSSTALRTVRNWLTFNRLGGYTSTMTQTRTETGSYIAICSACRTTVTTEDRHGKCSCGGWLVAGKAIKARVTDHECGVKCTSALGPACDCTCGGENHGADHRAA